MPPAKRQKSVKFVRKIREEMGVNLNEARLALGLRDVSDYKQFEAAKQTINAEKLMKLFAVCPDDAATFLQRIADEVGVDVSHKLRRKK